MHSALMITTRLRCTVLWYARGGQISLEYFVVVVLFFFFSISHEHMSALAVPFPQQTVASIHFFGRIEEKTIRQNERGPGRVSFGFQFFAVYPPKGTIHRLRSCK